MVTVFCEEQKRAPNGLWRTVRYTDTAAGRAKYLARHPYTWPGAYPVFAVTDDGAALCKDCVRTEFRRIAQSDPLDGWHVTTLAVNYERPDLHCDHCGMRIEAAYGEES